MVLCAPSFFPLPSPPTTQRCTYPLRPNKEVRPPLPQEEVLALDGKVSIRNFLWKWTNFINVVDKTISSSLLCNLLHSCAFTVSFLAWTVRVTISSKVTASLWMRFVNRYVCSLVRILHTPICNFLSRIVACEVPKILFIEGWRVVSQLWTSMYLLTGKRYPLDLVQRQFLPTKVNDYWPKAL